MGNYITPDAALVGIACRAERIEGKNYPDDFCGEVAEDFQDIVSITDPEKMDVDFALRALSKIHFLDFYAVENKIHIDRIYSTDKIPEVFTEAMNIVHDSARIFRKGEEIVEPSDKRRRLLTCLAMTNIKSDENAVSENRKHLAAARQKEYTRVKQVISKVDGPEGYNDLLIDAAEIELPPEELLYITTELSQDIADHKSQLNIMSEKAWRIVEARFPGLFNQGFSDLINTDGRLTGATKLQEHQRALHEIKLDDEAIKQRDARMQRIESNAAVLANVGIDSWLRLARQSDVDRVAKLTSKVDLTTPQMGVYFRAHQVLSEVQEDNMLNVFYSPETSEFADYELKKALKLVDTFGVPNFFETVGKAHRRFYKISGLNITPGNTQLPEEVDEKIFVLDNYLKGIIFKSMIEGLAPFGTIKSKSVFK